MLLWHCRVLLNVFTLFLIVRRSVRLSFISITDDNSLLTAGIRDELLCWKFCHIQGLSNITHSVILLC